MSDQEEWADYDVWVDFNGLDRECRTVSLRKFSRPDMPIEAGYRVLVGDHDGNTAEADVLYVDAVRIDLRIVMETFASN